MKIHNVTAQIGKLLKKDREEEKKIVPAGKQQLTAKDSLEVSANAREVDGLILRAMEKEEESEKVEAIKKQIDQGEYHVNSTKLAEAMLKKEDS
ncbi:MAG TPA: flagellar biosynthesis anti-sigma factor FlgM [Firmicutes bacterium]|nr:flagellar biosynthesis anti-sigma factor FlgM [Bacillota bacterium]